MTTLEKLEQLTHYIQMKNGQGDVVLDTTLDKLLAREEAKYAEWLAYLESQFAAFEAEYGLDSAVFYERYERGEMGDEIDFVEWAGLYDIYLRSQTKLGASPSVRWVNMNPLEWKSMTYQEVMVEAHHQMRSITVIMKGCLELIRNEDLSPEAEIQTLGMLTIQVQKLETLKEGFAEWLETHPETNSL